MRLAKTVLVLILAVYWPTATSHCLIEKLSGLEFFACCTHEETSDPHQDNDCHRNACAQVESGFYKTENDQLAVPPPAYTFVSLLLCATAGIDELSTGHPVITNFSPPELPVTWQFTHRAAAPPRAPSFVS